MHTFLALLIFIFRSASLHQPYYIQYCVIAIMFWCCGCAMVLNPVLQLVDYLNVRTHCEFHMIIFYREMSFLATELSVI